MGTSSVIKGEVKGFNIYIQSKLLKLDLSSKTRISKGWVNTGKNHQRFKNAVVVFTRDRH